MTTAGRPSTSLGGTDGRARLAVPPARARGAVRRRRRTLSPRRRSPALFMAGVVQTKTHGPGLYEAVAARAVQLLEEPRRGARLPDSADRDRDRLILHEAIDWKAISLHVPPADMPRLLDILANTSIEALRTSAAPMRRRLLWTSIYGTCHLRPGEGGTADAFDTLMQVLAKPRRHFAVVADHRAPRAPEMMDELYPWLKARGGDFCTRGYQCFDQWRRSCFEKYS